MGVMYAWFHTYRVVGPNPAAELALTPQQVHRLRSFMVTMRGLLSIGTLWTPTGTTRARAACPDGRSGREPSHRSPSGAIEPCPIIQFAKETIHDGGSFYNAMTSSAFLNDFRQTAAKATRGCIVLERTRPGA